MGLRKKEAAGAEALSGASLSSSPSSKAHAIDGSLSLRRIDNRSAEMPSAGCKWVLRSAL